MHMDLFQETPYTYVNNVLQWFERYKQTLFNQLTNLQIDYYYKTHLL